MNIIDIIKNSKFLKNFSVLAAGEVIGHAIGMLINITLARKLAPSMYGEYTLFLTYITLFYTVASLGLRQVVIRTIARNQANSLPIFKISILLRLIGFILAAVTFGIYNVIQPTGFSNLFILMLLAGVFCQSFWEAFQNVAFGMQKMQWTSIINVIGYLLMLLLYICIPAKIFTTTLVTYVYVGVFLIKDIIYLISLWKDKLLTTDKTQFSYPTKTLLTESIPFYILALFTLFSSQFPIIFLEKFNNLEEVAYFNTANKLLLPVSMLISTALSALYPNQSQSFVKGGDIFAKQTQKVLLFIATSGVILAFLISLFRKEFVYILFGTQYESTGDVMAFQCWYQVLYAIFCFMGNTFGAADKQKLLAVTSIIYALVSMPILYVGAKYGAVGLSMGYIVASIVNMTYNYYYLLKTTEFKIPWIFNIGIFGGIAVFMGISLLIPDDSNILLRLIIALLFSVSIYVNRNKLVTYFKSI